MSPQLIRPAAMLLAALLLAPSLLAEDSPSNEKAAASNEKADAAATDYSELVKQLDSKKFSQRQAASQKLAAAGKPAIDALIQAAQGNSREASTRAIDILKMHHSSANKELKDAAKSALEKIAQGTNPTAAKRAKLVLNPPKEPAAPGGIRVGPGGIRIAPGGGLQIGGNVQIQVRGVGGGVKRSVRIVNGVKTIETERDGKKVQIVDDPNNGIKMSITEKKGGKETTKKYEAKNADELKKKHPDAYKTYKEESAGAAGGIQIRGLQIQGGQAIPLPGIVPPPQRIQQIQQQQRARIEQLRRRMRIIRGDAADEAAKQIAEAQKQLQDQIQRLKKLGEDNDDQNQQAELKKAVEQLEKARQQLQEAKSRLEE